MKFHVGSLIVFLAASPVSAFPVKCCLTYKPVGHVRTDPIINQECLSDHVHTFYGPQRLRPETTPQDLLDTPIELTSGEVLENKSLYWHPSIYSVSRDGGNTLYNFADVSSTTTYYRFDDTRRNEMTPFPKGLVMIGAKDPLVSGAATESECCDNAEGDCVFSEDTGVIFPSQKCDLFSVWMRFPICWNGALDSDDHSSHVAYTVNGELDGDCPSTHQAGRFPQIQVFVGVENYLGGDHTFSDGSNVLHADFMNGWDEDTLQSILNSCQPADLGNPDACGCEDFFTMKGNGDDRRLDEDEDSGDCDEDEEDTEFLDCIQPPPLDTKATIAAEEVTGIASLPHDTCNGELLPPGSGGNTVDANGFKFDCRNEEEDGEDDEDEDGECARLFGLLCGDKE